MKLNVIKLDGTKAGDFTADKSVFGIAPNSAVVRQAILAELANMRQGTHATKNRAMVNGGGKKPWKQKGRGVARAGTTRSPIWRGGGVVFGPEPHRYSIKLPKKVGKLARRSLLSSKASDGRLVIIDELTMESHKTSDFVTILKKLGLDGKKITILITGFDQNLDRATRNLKNIYMVEASKASAYDLIDCEVVLIDKTSVTVLTNILKQ